MLQRFTQYLFGISATLEISYLKKIVKNRHGHGALLARLKFALVALTRDRICGDPSWHSVSSISPLPSHLGASVKNNGIFITSCSPIHVFHVVAEFRMSNIHFNKLFLYGTSLYYM